MDEFQLALEKFSMKREIGLGSDADITKKKRMGG